MNSKQFEDAAIAILRSDYGWQTGIARRLVNKHDSKPIAVRTVRRWIKADEVPEWAAKQLQQMRDSVGPSPYPRDEWIIGDGEQGREYIGHCRWPRFWGRIYCKDDPTESPVDLTSGVVHWIDENTVICEIGWIDKPDPDQITQLMEAASVRIEESVDP